MCAPQREIVGIVPAAVRTPSRGELDMSHAIMAAIRSGLRVEGLHLPGVHFLDIGIPENLVQALRTNLDTL
jgi:dTDP-glucose pyrophosphorylase